MFVRSLIPYRRTVTPLHRIGLRCLDTEVNEVLAKVFDLPTQSDDAQGFLSAPIDVVGNEKNVQLMAELPGLEEQDIEVSIDNNVLTIKGEKKQEKEEKHKKYYRMGRSFGTFHRSISLPSNVLDASKCDAAFKNGVLTITIPKKAKAEKKVNKIPVKAG